MKSKLPTAERPIVLIAEDEPIIARGVGLALRKAGFQTHWIKDGVKAINWIFFSRPTAIVLDLMLPRLGGAEICTMVRKTEGVSATPIVVISGQSAMNLGADFHPRCGHRYLRPTRCDLR